MPFELFLALRYLYSRRRRPLARMTALAAIAGVAFGVAAMIVALALSNGFRDEMRDKILRGTAHITLMRKDGAPIKDYPELISHARAVEGVLDASATTYDGALLTGGGGKASVYAVLRGLDTESSHAVEQLRRTLIEGSLDPVLKDPSPFAQASSEAAPLHAVIGAELAARAGLRVGDTVSIISGDATLKPPKGVPQGPRPLRIAGIFRSGLYEYDAAWVYVPLAVAASLAGETAPSASVISLEVADIYKVGQVAARLRERVGEAYTTVDWQEANRPLFAALTLERRMGLFIIALIIFVAALNITTTLILVVVERRSDIAILTAMGARRLSIMLIFMIEGALIGLTGALLGISLGLVACFIGDHYQLVSLPADVYSLSHVPFHPHVRDVGLAALVAFALSLLATLYPARAAALVRPAEALRDQ
jgi:lipoprotein-releasing system permease protein